MGRDAFGFTSDECVGVEDAEAGVEAIHSAGMKAVGVGTPELMHAADFVTSTADLDLAAIKKAFDME